MYRDHHPVVTILLSTGATVSLSCLLIGAWLRFSH